MSFDIDCWLVLFESPPAKSAEPVRHLAVEIVISRRIPGDQTGAPVIYVDSAETSADVKHLLAPKLIKRFQVK
jgi:hypothetical protein